MKKIKWALWMFLLGTTLLWLVANPVSLTAFDTTSLRKALTQYSGIIAIGAMSLSMILATRLKGIERYLDGLDKGYRLHKWLGIAGLSAAITHWLITTSGWGRGGGGRRSNANLFDSSTSSLEQFFDSLHRPAEGLGEWAFYIAAVLLVMALIKQIPYRFFVKLHKWLAVAYLVLAFHSLVLLDFSNWRSPIGWLMAIFLIGGSISAIWVLLKKVGKSRQFNGTVTDIQYYNDLDGYAVTIDLPHWRGHQAGQFAFVSQVGHSEKAHPFTIASHWSASSSHLRFLIKSLGDYTAKLKSELSVGDYVTVEGAYGQFTFEDKQAHQIWVAGGIGIAPFIARLQALHQQSSSQQVTLFYSYETTEQHLLDEIHQLAQKSNITLYLWSVKEKPFLTAEAISELIPNWAQSSLWFCGPSQFAKQLRQDFIKQGLPSKHFHQEIFEIR